MTPWRFARPVAFTLLSGVVALYLVFSPLGLASAQGPGAAFATLCAALVLANMAVWWASAREQRLS